MLTPGQSDVVRDLGQALTCSTPLERAELLQALTLAVYDHVKEWVPGGGLDGRDSDERAAVGLIVDAARPHFDLQRELALDARN